MFRVCKKPINYDAAMQNLVKSTMGFIPVLHSIFAIFVFGNKEIFNANYDDKLPGFLQFQVPDVAV